MGDSAESDAALVWAARGGDKSAFAELLGRHRPVLVSLCRRALRDALLAEDAAQEAALQALLSLERLRQPAQFGPWLHGIGLNICRRWLRDRSEDWWSWEALLGGSQVAEPVDLDASPPVEVERADLVERVRYAVSQLPPGQRAAVMLFYLSGLSHAATAGLLGIEVGAVKTRLHKARAALRDKLWTIWKEETMTAETETGMVEMRVVDVWRLPARGDKPGQSIVVLAEVGGERRFPIWIGGWEADSLAMTMAQMEMPRPMTYVFASRLLDAAGGRLREVQITRLADTTYYAEAIVDGPAGERRFDARTSDALNLAVLMGSPIRVAPAVIEQSIVTRASHEKVRAAMREAGVPEEELPTDEHFEHMRKIVSGELTGGTAEIVAELKAGRSKAGL